MHFSRLFSVVLVGAVAVGVTIVACGGNSSSKPDSKIVVQDSRVFLDAGSGSGGSDSLGKSCTGTGSGDQSSCNTSDPICTSLTGTAWFCTADCGSGPCATGGTAGSSTCFGSGTTHPRRRQVVTRSAKRR